jgi:hypothetical protein
MIERVLLPLTIRRGALDECTRCGGNHPLSQCDWPLVPVAVPPPAYRLILQRSAGAAQSAV